MSYLISYRTSLELGSEKTRKYLQNLKVGWRESLVPSLPSRRNTPAITANSSQEPWIKYSTGDLSLATPKFTL